VFSRTAVRIDPAKAAIKACTQQAAGIVRNSQAPFSLENLRVIARAIQAPVSIDQ
jgi:hypothetical protein